MKTMSASCPPPDAQVHVVGGRSVAAKQPVLAELPELAAFRARLLRELFVEVVLGDFWRGFVLRSKIEPRGVVAGQTDIEAGVSQRLHLPAQDGLIRRGLRQQVVGVDEGAPLGLAQALDLDARELRVAPLPRRQDPPVPVDQTPLGVDPGRHDPAELVEAVDQAVDLLLRMQLRVALVGDQLVDLAPDEPDPGLLLRHVYLLARRFFRAALCFK